MQQLSICVYVSNKLISTSEKTEAVLQRRCTRQTLCSFAGVSVTSFTTINDINVQMMSSLEGSCSSLCLGFSEVKKKMNSVIVKC